MLAQSHNHFLSLTTSFTQPKKNPNLLPVHMESRISQHPPAQPSTNNPTPTTYESDTQYSYLTRFDIFVKVLGILIISGIALLIYFAYPPINKMSSYTVTSATVDPFNISSSQLTAAWNISIYIKNYDEDMYFDRVQSSIYYGSHLLSQVSIPSFSVQSWWHKTLQDRLMAHSKSLDVDAVESMVQERLLRGAVDFRVELLARTKYLWSLSRWMKFKISCDNVTVGFPATHDVGPGVMLGPRRKCSVLVDGKIKKRV